MGACIVKRRRGKPDQPGCLTPHSSNRSHAFSPINKIARFAQTVQPQPLPIVKPEAQQLAALRRRRQQLVAMLVAEKNRLSRADKIVQVDIKEHLEQIEQQLKSLNQQIQTLTSATIGLET